MPGKRKRDGSAVIDASSGSADGSVKPITAVAAAKLRSHIPDSSNQDGTRDVERAQLPDSVESEVDDDVEEAAPTIQRNLQLCTWRYRRDHVSSDSDEQLTVSLDKNKTIALIGSFDFVMLKGAININGANFAARYRTNQPAPIHRAFLPSTHSISSIRGLDNENEIQFISCDEPTPFASLSPLFANIWNAKSKRAKARSFDLITESKADPLKRPISPEIVPEDWTRQVEDCSSTPSITLITGAPSSGKSTFARRLLNRYLTGLGKSAPALSSVFYLDLDPNKPAYTPHGQLSLVLVREVDLGPAFMHASTCLRSSHTNMILRSHTCPVRGSSNFVDYFISCVEDLFNTYLSLQAQNASTPLIINTSGWSYTAGFNTLLHMLSRFKPQRLVHLSDLQSIDEENAAKLDALDSTARKRGVSVSHLSAQTCLNSPPRTDAELRSMQMLSHFHCSGLSNSAGSQLTYDPKPLSHTAPWEFCYQKTNKSRQHFVGFLMLSEWIEPGQIFASLNGSIIHIVETEDDNIHLRFGQLPRTNKYRIPYFEKSSNGIVEPLDPKTSRLVCTALIRGWSPENRTVQVIVPKTHEELLHGLQPEKTVFVFGCCEHPEWAYTEDDYYELSDRMTGCQIDESVAPESIDLRPWVAKASAVEEMGFLNTARRVRKFQQ